jgi:Family of unknown function (DUF5994)
MTALTTAPLPDSPVIAVPEPATPVADLTPAHGRLALRQPDGAGTRFVDGGWWPRSLDLTAELPALISAAEAAGYNAVRRVTYHLGGWDSAPRRAAMLGRVIKLSGYRTQVPAAISLVDGSGWDHIDIVVIPPDTDAEAAGRALKMAGEDSDQHRAGEILELAGS